MTSLGWSALFALAVVLFTGVFVSCDRMAPKRQDALGAIDQVAGPALLMDCRWVGGPGIGGGDLYRCENAEAVCYLEHGAGGMACSGKGRRFTFHDDPD